MANQPNDGSTGTKRKSNVLLWLLVGGGGCLMLVVCGGILSAIAIPSFINYTRRAKVAEADAQLSSLGYLVESYCRERGELPGRAGPVPPAPGAGEKQIGDFASDPVFRELGFAPSEPLYFSYEVRPGSPGQVELRARGDLDADGMHSAITWQCRLAGCACEEDLVPESERIE